MKLTKLMLLTLCLTGSMIYLSAQETAADDYQKFPECRVYSVNGEADIKETFEKIDSLSSLAAFYDEDGAKFNLQQAKAGKDVQYNMIVWDAFVNIKKEELIPSCSHG